MGESEVNNDCWSLLAVVRECSAKSKSKQPNDTSKASYTTTLVPYHGGATLLDDCIDPPSPATALTVTNHSWLDEPFIMHCSTLSEDVKSSDQLVQRGCFLGKKSDSYAHRQSISMKKSKNEEKKVCKLSMEELSCDKWHWRKYGQKPIKGSPYPRNYYRCSSLKGCTARKQVERSPIDPNKHIVTYTGHHHHSRPTPRNTLASRVKPSVINHMDNPDSLHNGSSGPSVPTCISSGSDDFETLIERVGYERD